MATTTEWVAGARLRTLPLAVAPVLAGTGTAIGMLGTDGVAGVAGVAGHWGGRQVLEALLALVVSLALQVGVNYANDYSDGIRGTDDDRVGPFRLTGSGAAAPAAVKNAAFTSFAVAGVAGLVLVAVAGQWWLLLVGVLCVLAAWYYTGGSRPYGYSGFGEIAVFVFFGLVAVLGTTYTQVGSVSWAALGAATGMGALACGVLVANNLRDIPTDSVSGKHTLAVRLGDPGTRRLYLVLIAVPYVLVLLMLPAHLWAALALLSAPAAISPVKCVVAGEKGLGLIPALKDTGRLALVWALLLAIGLAL